MKRLILTSLIAAGVVMAQAPATGTAPAAPKTPSSQKPAVKRHTKKAKKPVTAPSTAQAPAAKQGK